MPRRIGDRALLDTALITIARDIKAKPDTTECCGSRRCSDGWWPRMINHKSVQQTIRYSSWPVWQEQKRQGRRRAWLRDPRKPFNRTRRGRSTRPTSSRAGTARIIQWRPTRHATIVV